MQCVHCFSYNKEHDIRSVIHKGVIWFNGRDCAKAMGYSNISQALSTIDYDDQVQYGFFDDNADSQKAVYITEYGVFTLIYNSEEDNSFKFWLNKICLPRLRKSFVDHLCTERDLHVKVVSMIRRFFPDAILNSESGFLQNSSIKRLESWRRGYMAGSPDITILNHHKKYDGLCIELKNPQRSGKLSLKQVGTLEQYKASGYQILVSDNYETILFELFNYFQDVRTKCDICNRKFKNKKCLGNHLKGFHHL